MNYRIVVDAGHGGEDPGAVNGNLLEKDFNLRAANYMYNRFQELGVPVAATRTTDETLERQERIDRILEPFGNGSNVILLSNHINAGGGEGAEVVYALRNNDTLARNVLEAIGDAGQITRKYYQRRLPSDPSQDYYYIMRDTKNVTPLLIEYGFIDTPADVTKLQNNLLDYVEGVVKAVTNYIGVPYVSPEGDTEEYYIVQSGDSLWSIAKKFNTTVSILRDINNLTSDVLRIGQRLILPTMNVTPPSGNTYIVKSGDSLWKIANQFGVSVDDLISANNLTSTVLQIGDVLIIPGQGEEPEQNYISYTVQRGDSLWLIANRYDTTVDEIRRLNNLTSNTLQIGQVLKIPTTGGIQEPEVGYINYTVQRGDSLWLIANRYNTSVDEIKRLNNLTSNTLQIGQVLRIPTISGGEDDYINYIVRNGDSLWSIANRYDTTVNEIRTLNNLTSSILQIGQVLKIPV